MARECPKCSGSLVIDPETPNKATCQECGASFRQRSADDAPAAKPKSKAPSLKKTCAECGAHGGAKERTCPQCGASFLAARQAAKAAAEGGDIFADEKKGIDSGVMGGIIMLVIAGVWFFVGLQGGYIFYYPPILALLGIYAIIKGLATGNMAGGKNKRRRRSRPRAR